MPAPHPHIMKAFLRIFPAALCLILAAGLISCGKKNESGGAKRPRIAYMGNAVAPFWSIAEKGARKAGEDFGADVEVRMPQNGAADQKRLVEELLARGVDGV